MTARLRQPAGRSRRKRSSTASARPVRPPLDEMTPGELRTWIVVTRSALQKKMARERAYLDRRAARGTFTPTDGAYEAYQRLEADLVEMLHEFERVVVQMATGGTTA